MSNQEHALHRDVEGRMSSTTTPAAPKSWSNWRCPTCGQGCGGVFGTEEQARAAVRVLGGTFAEHMGVIHYFDSLNCVRRYNVQAKHNGQIEAVVIPDNAPLVAAPIPQAPTGALGEMRDVTERTVTGRCGRCGHRCEVAQSQQADGSWSPDLAERLTAFGWITSARGRFCGGTCAQLAESSARFEESMRPVPQPARETEFAARDISRPTTTKTRKR